MTIDPGDPRPPSRQIADDLRSMIKGGEIPPGGKLPTNRELATQYGVTRVTAARAISQLGAEGLVVTRHGSGAYVRKEHPVRRLGPDRYARHRWTVTVVEAFADHHQKASATEQQGDQRQTVQLVAADDRVAEALGVDVGSSVYERDRVVTREGTPTHTMTSYYRPEDVEGTTIVDPSPGMARGGGSFGVFAERGQPPHEITEELFARAPTPAEVEALDLPAGEPVVELHRTTRTAEGRVIEYARGVHAASRFLWAYTYEIPD